MYSGFSGGRQRVGNVTQVNDPSTAWVNQEPHWGLIEHLLGGTYKIRKGTRKFLPQEPRELDESYDNRLQRSVLAPYYVRLERMLAGSCCQRFRRQHHEQLRYEITARHCVLISRVSGDRRSHHPARGLTVCRVSKNCIRDDAEATMLCE